MTGEARKESTTVWVCPVCGKRLMSGNELCSGSFFDDKHPSNVVPIVGTPPDELQEISRICGSCGHSFTQPADVAVSEHGRCPHCDKPIPPDLMARLEASLRKPMSSEQQDCTTGGSMPPAQERPSREELGRKKRTALWTAVWEASQVLSDDEIRDCVERTLVEIGSDQP